MWPSVVVAALSAMPLRRVVWLVIGCNAAVYDNIS